MGMPGGDRLRKARRILEEDNCDRKSLLSAAAEFWAATFDSDGWPTELRAKSLTARFALVRHGTFEESVRHLDDASLRRLCRELVEVADMADRLDAAAG